MVPLTTCSKEVVKDYFRLINIVKRVGISDKEAKE